MKLAIYVRVSTEEQAEHGLSLQAQETALRKYAESVQATVVDVYKDEGYSATNLDRPSLQRLLDDIRKGKIDNVIFTKLDRLSRGVANYYKIMNVFEEHNVDWKTILEEYDSSTAAGRLHINIMLSVAENESAVLKERINFVFHDKLKKGEPLSGKVMPGYKIENKKYVIDEAIAPMIQEAFKIFNSKASIKETIIELKKSYPDLFNKSESANHAYLARILRKELYTGTYTHEGVRYENFAPSLIDTETFLKAQNFLSKNRRSANKVNCYGRFFSGIVKCPYGRNFSFNVNSRRPNLFYIRCSRSQCKIKERGECPTPIKSKNIIKAERLIVKKLKEEIYNMDLKVADRIDNKDTEGLQNKIKECKAKLSRLQDLYVDGMIDKSKFNKKFEELNDEIENLEKELKLANGGVDNNISEVIIDGNFDKLYWNMNSEQKRVFWINAVEKIVIDKDWNIFITF